MNFAQIIYSDFAHHLLLLPSFVNSTHPFPAFPQVRMVFRDR